MSGMDEKEDQYGSVCVDDNASSDNANDCNGADGDYGIDDITDNDYGAEEEMYLNNPLVNNNANSNNNSNNLTTIGALDDAEMEELVQTYLYNKNFKTSRNEAVFNIVYSLINAALLALPYTASECGVLIFSISVIFFGVISAYSTVMVVQLATDTKVRNLEDLAEHSFGIKGLYLVGFFQLLYSLSLMCISLSVYADIMAEVVWSTSGEYFRRGFFALASSRGQVLVGALFVLFICTATRSMISLRFTSYFTALAVVMALVAVTGALISDFTTDNSIQTVDFSINTPHDRWWIFVFIIPFCFSFNQKALMVYSCLRERSVPRWTSSVRRGLSVVIFIYLLFGDVGYIAQFVHDAGSDNIMIINFFRQNIAGNKIFIDIIRSVVAVSILLTIPVDCLVASTTAKKLYRRFVKIKGGSIDTKENIFVGGKLTKRSFSDGSSHKQTGCISSCCPFMIHKESTLSSNNEDMQRGVARAISQSSSDGKPIVDEDWDYDPSNITNSSSSATASNRDTNDFRSSGGTGDSFRNSSGTVGRKSNISGGRNSGGSFYKYGISEGEDSEQTNNGSSGAALSVIHEDRRGGGGGGGVSSGLNSSSAGFSNNNSGNNRESENSNSSHSSFLGSFRDSEDLIRCLDGRNPDNNNKSPLPNLKSLDKDTKRGTGISNKTASGDVSFDDEVQSEENLRLKRPNSTVNSPIYNSNDNNNNNNNRNRIDSHRSYNYSSRDMTLSMVESGDLSARPGANYFNDIKRLNKRSALSWTFFVSIFPTLILWLIMTSVCMFAPRIAHLAAALGSLTTAMLVYIIPSMMYFRLGLLSDYQVIPVMGFIPNRVYMFFVQIIGIALFLSNCILLLYCLVTDAQIINS